MTSKPPPSGATPSSTIASFEDAIGRLSAIVQALEEGDLSLEESLRLFEEGVKLSRVSQDKLDRAQKRVEELLKVDEQGRPRTVPFETRADDDEGPYEP
jgi:exodeoxyribonuclease VII small subunit